jgi:phenylalanyl-tRNA synthetase beta chain
MDAMCHLGVAKDVCAYLSHHIKKDTVVKSPFKNNFKVDHQGLQFDVIVENTDACKRYAGVSIQGVTIGESPTWLQQKLKAIGIKSINNIVDITNYILHETGQPLHAFDAAIIEGKKIIVKNLPKGTPFISLDDKERKLSANDLMICDGKKTPMCIGGVFGGLTSGIKSTTKNIFLESAWFNPSTIRKSSLHHGLRTDAATRFEKGVDISNTVNVLKRAAMLIKEIAGGKIASDIIDIYPTPKEKTEVALKYHYLKKISGKNYHGDAVKNILTSLGFEIMKEGMDELLVKVPFSKSDISIPADLVEEIMRIDGLDNVEIPQYITIAPAIETLGHQHTYQEKVSNYLVGLGFNEIFTNSITNSAYFDDATLQTTVKMMNNLSTELDVLRPSMLQTGLHTIAHNINRKNTMRPPKRSVQIPSGTRINDPVRTGMAASSGAWGVAGPRGGSEEGLPHHSSPAPHPLPPSPLVGSRRRPPWSLPPPAGRDGRPSPPARRAAARFWQRRRRRRQRARVAARVLALL